MKSVMLFQEAIDNGKVRKTEDEWVSVIDAIMAMTGKDANYSAQILRRVVNNFPDVNAKMHEHQFPGQGQRPTPIADAESMVQIMMLLPGERAVAFRLGAARLVLAYLKADITLADDILQRTNRENAEWLGLRARVKSSHSILTDAMRAAGIVEHYMYIQAANINYRTLFGKTAKELRDERGVMDARASLSGDELSALEFAERAQAKMLAEGKPEGNKAVVAELKRIAESVKGIIGTEKAA